MLGTDKNCPVERRPCKNATFYYTTAGRVRPRFPFSRRAGGFLRRHANLRNFDGLLVGALLANCQQNVKSLSWPRLQAFGQNEAMKFR
jgi:hypothetical protein